MINLQEIAIKIAEFVSLNLDGSSIAVATTETAVLHAQETNVLWY